MIKRRTFVKSGTLTAFSIAAFGTIHWNGTKYVTANPTTTDILGPFYRPGSPIRTNLVPAGSQGTPMRLLGTVLKQDGTSPLEGALIEAWQCDEKQQYDNTSDDFLFRGATKTGKDGRYGFETIVPVPYKISSSSWRPAHIHLLVSSPECQDLITQIYFKGDPHLADDSSSASPSAAGRILEIGDDNGEKAVHFDIVMRKHIPLDDSVYAKISGLYDMDRGMIEFYRQDDLLMVKRNGQITEGLTYTGNNTFEEAMGLLKVRFDLQSDGGVKAVLIEKSYNQPDQVTTRDAVKFLKYQ